MYLKKYNSRQLFRDYLQLCKPKVILLMLITSWVGMHLATYEIVSIAKIIIATIGISLSAGSAAVINHLADRHIDSKMFRTAKRPIADGRISPRDAILFSILIGASGIYLLYSYINSLTALLTFLSLIGYAFVYTMFLKYATPQNIVIGGIVGATPPLLGWTAVTGNLDPHALILALIIFIWTPPHFWALAIHRHDDYKNAQIPMLPATHGIAYTKLQMLLYTVLLFAVCLLPFATTMSGAFYLISSSVLNLRYCYLTYIFYKDKSSNGAMALFQFSILYLSILFLLLLIDHYIQMYIISQY